MLIWRQTATRGGDIVGRDDTFTRDLPTICYSRLGLSFVLIQKLVRVIHLYKATFAFDSYTRYLSLVY